MGGQFLQANHTITTMYKLVVLSACVATAFSQAVPIQAYAGSLQYGAGYPGAFAAGYAAAPAAYAAAPAAPAIPAAYAASLPAPAQIALPQPAVALPRDYATGPASVYHPVPAAAAPIPDAGLGLPEAATYGLPPVRQVAKAPIVENFIEPVEQWGYKVAY